MTDKKNISNDSELESLIHAAEGTSAADQHELAVAVSGKIVIANIEFPAPAAAVLALLESIRSPFVPDPAATDEELKTPCTDLDVFRALYLLAKREDAVMPILRMKRREAALERLEENLKERDPQAMLVLAGQYRELADMEAEFDERCFKFAETLGSFDVSEAASAIGMYLAMAGGFSMLPEPEGKSDSKKKSLSTSITSPRSPHWYQLLCRLFRCSK